MVRRAGRRILRLDLAPIGEGLSEYSKRAFMLSRTQVAQRTGREACPTTPGATLRAWLSTALTAALRNMEAAARASPSLCSLLSSCWERARWLPSPSNINGGKSWARSTPGSPCWPTDLRRCWPPLSSPSASCGWHTRARIDRGAPKHGGRGARITIIVLAIVILLGARSLASFSIEYQWWKELGQVDTWLNS